MIEPQNHSERVEVLRAYLLGTLESGEVARVETALSEDPAWQVELERQRESLTMLDALPETPPPTGLAGRTLAAVRDDEEALRRKKQRRARVIFAEAAVLLVAVGVITAILLPALTRAREASRRASSQSNLKQLALVMKMYANESPGEVYPPMTPYDGLWMFDIERVYPEYLTDLNVLVNPSLPGARDLSERLHELVRETPVDWREITRIAAKSYVYTGWSMANDADAAALDEILRNNPEETPHGDLVTQHKAFYHLREGVERFLITDINNPAGSDQAQSEIPVMFEAVPKDGIPNQGMGINVGYMDGHVKFVKSGSRFPATETGRRVFGEPIPAGPKSADAPKK